MHMKFTALTTWRSLTPMARQSRSIPSMGFDMVVIVNPSNDPNTAGDVAAQIGALRLELDSVRTCLDVFQRALAASGGGATANYC